MHNRLQALLLTALMVWSMALPAMGANPFFDVPEDHWAYDAVEYLAEAGLVEGYPDGTFSGSRNFTRYEMALVFARIVARFEQYVDQLVAEGIDSRLDELSAQVAIAMKDASEALRAASEAQPADSEQIQAALEAAKNAQALAEQAMQVAVGTLEAIDARGWEQQMTEADAQISAAAAKAQQALEAAQKAMDDAAIAMQVAVGTLEVIDARDWEGQMAELGTEARSASTLAAEALAAAEKALTAANDAMEVAVGTLAAIDARDYDARIDSAAATAEQAMGLAEKALANADEAVTAATTAMQVAVGTLEVIDARDWEGQIADARAKADEALALARSIAALPSAEQSGTPAAAAPSFTAEARAAIEEIAAKVVMDKLADVKAYADAIAKDVTDIRTDLDAAKALIAAEADRLEESILSMTQEFANELEVLGVRVAALEAKFTTLDTRVATLETVVDEHGRELVALRTDVDRYKISGFNEIRAIYGESEGTGTIRNNPRDRDSGTFSVPQPGVANQLQIRLDGKPNDEVDLVALLDLVLDTRSGRALSAIMEDSYAFAELTSEQPVRVVRLGYLDSNRVASGFSPQLLDAKTFDKTRNIGAFTNIVSATMDTDLFAATVLQNKQIVAGVSTEIDMGEMDVQVGAVRLFDNANPRTGVQIDAAGESASMTYSAHAIVDVENSAQIYKAAVEVPFESAKLTGTLQRIHPDWADSAKRLPFAAEVKKQDPNKADKVVDVNNDVFAGQSLVKGRIDMPVGSFKAFAQMGRYRSGSTVDMFGQYGVYDLNLLGFDTSITRSNFIDQHDQVLTDQRATLATQFDGIDLKVELNNAIDGQKAASDLDAYRTQFMVSLAKPVTILVPMEASVNFGVNLSDDVDHPMHGAYKLELKDYQLLPDVLVGAEISGQSNVITDGKWRLNSTWTGHSKSTRAIDAQWRVAAPISLTAGVEIVDHSHDGRITTQDAGVEYLMADAFGGDLKLGYGYRVVYEQGTIDGTPRNVLSAAYTRTAGDFTLSADAKRYIGGTTKEEGNDVDTIASLKLSYPVFKGAAFTVDGKYVSSSGAKADEYEARSLTAGLRFNF